VSAFHLPLPFFVSRLTNELQQEIAQTAAQLLLDSLVDTQRQNGEYSQQMTRAHASQKCRYANIVEQRGEGQRHFRPDVGIPNSATDN
jgi:hypothetical protein